MRYAILSPARLASEDWDDALRNFEEALESHHTHSEPAAELLGKIGLVHFYRGFLNRALDHFERSKAVAEATASDQHIAQANNCLAVAHQGLGQLDVAVQLYETAQQQAVALGNDLLAVMIEQNLGTIAGIRGDTESALKRFQSALDRCTALNDAVGVARALNNIGMAHITMQRYSEAQEAFDRALFQAEQAKDAETIGTVQLNRADLYLRLERYDDARACCDQAFEIFSRIGSTSGLGEAYKSYGILYRQSGKLHLAEAHLAAVSELAAEADHPLLEAEAERERALVHLEQGRKSEALRSLNRAHRLFTDLAARRELVDVEHELDALEQSYLKVVRVWGESIETRDGYTAGHCARVAEYTVRLAQAVGFSGRELTWLRMGAFLHDVGKTRMPPEMLRKPAGLDEEEWQRMRQHTVLGDEIVAELDFPYDLRPMVRSHHERWDGTGYPDRLQGDDIPLVARILCIADVFDAMTTDRAYRSGHSKEDALKLMALEAGKMLDPGLFETFRKIIEE